jgi:hypothetical protein
LLRLERRLLVGGSCLPEAAVSGHGLNNKNTLKNFPPDADDLKRSRFQ